MNTQMVEENSVAGFELRPNDRRLPADAIDGVFGERPIKGRILSSLWPNAIDSCPDEVK